MTTTSTDDQLASDISSLERRVAQLQPQAQLNSLRDRVEDLGTTAEGLEQRVQSLRARGYVYERGLEAEAGELRKRWSQMRLGILRQINTQAQQLQRDVKPLEDQLGQLVARARHPASARPLHTRLESAVRLFEEKASAAQNTISGMFDEFGNKVFQFTSRLDKIDWMLKQLAEASFKLLPTEGGLAAVKAGWVKGRKEQDDDPQGVLYLTDQRLILEQKQEIVTKKVLFIAKEKESVQQLLWEVPVVQVDRAQPSKKGLFGKDDYLEIDFKPGAPLNSVNLHLFGQDGDTWQGLLGRAQAREFDQDRAVEVDQAEAEKAKAAPTQCPSCGGPITDPVLRGMDTLTCKFCGHVIRL